MAAWGPPQAPSPSFKGAPGGSAGSRSKRPGSLIQLKQTVAAWGSPQAPPLLEGAPRGSAGAWSQRPGSITTARIRLRWLRWSLVAPVGSWPK
eukprot:6121749-Alexandrium_andersonii.AAC.1